MKGIGWVVVGMFLGVFLTITFFTAGASQSALAKPIQPLAGSTPAPSVGPSGRILNAASGDEAPQPAGAVSVQAVSALPTAAPGETLVYFFPTDSVATGTVLNILNTDSVQHSVTFRGYSYNGAQIYTLTFNIAATSLQRLVSDDIVASAPASWVTPIPYVTSFGDSVYFASLSLPKGVKADGYTVYNQSTGTIDPNIDQGAKPLRFSTDPLTVFVPAVSN